MEITLLNMDVAATSLGNISTNNSQPGDNAPTFAQILDSQSQNTKSNTNTTPVDNQATKESKPQKHTEEKKPKEEDNTATAVSPDSVPKEQAPQEKPHLGHSLPDNDQYAAIIENRTSSSLMSAEELAAELPVQLAGLPGLKRVSLSEAQLGSATKSAGQFDLLARSLPKENADIGLTTLKAGDFSAHNEKSLLAQLRPESAAITTESAKMHLNVDDKPPAKKASAASLFTPVAERMNTLLNGDKSALHSQLADNTNQQLTVGNSVAERNLHNTLSTTSALAANNIANHIPTNTNLTPQVHFSSVTAQTLTAQVGTPEWQQQLNQQIVMFSRNGLQKAELRLHPEELGSLHIRMKIEDGQAQLHLASQNGQVRTVLENAIHHLRQALSENGIQLTQSQVSSDAQGGWQQENMADSSQFSGDGADNHQGREGNSTQLSSETVQSTVTLTPQQIASARGGVDIFA